MVIHSMGNHPLDHPQVLSRQVKNMSQRVIPEVWKLDFLLFRDEVRPPAVSRRLSPHLSPLTHSKRPSLKSRIGN